MPTVDEMWAKKNAFTKSASEIFRTLALAGFAVIWIFRVSLPGGGSSIQPGMMWAAFILALAMLADWMQYLVGAWRTDNAARKTEKELRANSLPRLTSFQYPPNHPRPMNFLWLSKIVMVMLAWLILLVVIADRAVHAGLPELSR